MHFYRAYGLSVQSELPLPELSPGSASEPDVVIRFGELRHLEPPVNGARGYVHVGATEARCGWPEVGAFHVRGGREIVVDPAPGTDPGYVRLVLLGTILAILLHQRGFL